MRRFLLKEPVEFSTPVGHRFRIILHFCKGCRICVAFCPTEALDLDERLKVKVAHPERCVGCRICELRCPDLAIFVTRAKGRGTERSGDRVRGGDAARDVGSGGDG